MSPIPPEGGDEGGGGRRVRVGWAERLELAASSFLRSILQVGEMCVHVLHPVQTQFLHSEIPRNTTLNSTLPSLLGVSLNCKFCPPPPPLITSRSKVHHNEVLIPITAIIVQKAFLAAYKGAKQGSLYISSHATYISTNENVSPYPPSSSQ